MNRQKQENRKTVDKLDKIFETNGYPCEFPWIMNFLAKVSLNKGAVNTENQRLMQ